VPNCTASDRGSAVRDVLATEVITFKLRFDILIVVYYRQVSKVVMPCSLIDDYQHTS